MKSLWVSKNLSFHQAPSLWQTGTSFGLALLIRPSPATQPRTSRAYSIVGSLKSGSITVTQQASRPSFRCSCSLDRFCPDCRNALRAVASSVRIAASLVKFGRRRRRAAVGVVARLRKNGGSSFLCGRGGCRGWRRGLHPLPDNVGQVRKLPASAGTGNPSPARRGDPVAARRKPSD